MKSKITGINFEIGKPVKCVKMNISTKDKYFKIVNIKSFTTSLTYDIILELRSIDKRYYGNEYSNLYAYRFENVGQEYIILKLKGVVE